MLTRQKVLKPGISAGKFGYSGRRVIKGFEVPEAMVDKYLKVFRRLVKIDICGCWVWQGRIHNKYGCFPSPGGSTLWAHRVSYALFHGSIKPERHIDHICRNPACVNPAHLKQVHPVENYNAVFRRKRRDEFERLEAAGQQRLWK